MFLSPLVAEALILRNFASKFSNIEYTNVLIDFCLFSFKYFNFYLSLIHDCIFYTRLVCYLVNKKWLTDGPTVELGKRSPKRENTTPGSLTGKPGCSHWEDGK